jgi:site-specific DNA-methyltransferase (cytosine-N4-specific)
LPSLTLTKTTTDWTFKEISTSQYTHGFHQYPARMHPEIATRLIEKYSTDSKTVVLDPFMGSGGVLVESMLHGNNSIGIDLNPFAVLLSKVKTTPLDPKKLEKTLEDIQNTANADYKNNITFQNTPEKLDLSFWYPKDPIQKLPILKNSINQIKNKSIREFFLICFSFTTRRTSFQKNSVYKIYRMKPELRAEFEPDTFKKFSDICKKNIQNMNDFNKESKKQKSKAFTILGDSRDIGKQFSKIPHDVLDDGKAHLVVTSPPYGDHGTTVAYGQFSKHPGLWLDLKEKEELLSVDSNGLGGRKIKDSSELESPILDKLLKKIKKKDAEAVKKTNLSDRAGDVYAFFYDLDSCLEQLSLNLKQGKSNLCFVVANRMVRREKVQLDEILIEIAKKWDIKKDGDIIYRTIANKATATKNAPENISNKKGDTMNQESIVLLKF